MSTIAVEEFAPLRGRIAGQLFTPSDAGWDEARLAWNLAVDQRPAAVVVAESADDIVETVRFARRMGYTVAGQGTGHGASSLEQRLDGTILIKTQRMRDVEIDPVGRWA
jgi:FAD/FMN-containing dehydrogenase